MAPETASALKPATRERLARARRTKGYTPSHRFWLARSLRLKRLNRLTAPPAGRLD